MLRELHDELSRGTHDQLIHNANIEAFLVHARNLIEFFKNKPPCDFDPRLFTNAGYEPDGNFIDSTLEAKINQQVSHLTAERTAVANEQLGPEEWRKIRSSIETQIKRFENALKPEYKAKWTPTPKIIAVKPGAPGPTNAIWMTATATISADLPVSGEIVIDTGHAERHQTITIRQPR